ncbi:MAG: rod shape-determining protein RodA [Sedimentisphaerales bacterium]|nr:rod shape-determining protein RodA [Sedimentisphaerales bacterium]
MLLKRIWQGHLLGLRLSMILAVIALLAIGLASIYATGRMGDFRKQLMWIGLGALLFVFLNLFSYRVLGQASDFLFVFTLMLLAFLLVGKYLGWRRVVPVIGGASRWIKLLPLDSSNFLVRAARIQPSEIAKLTYILALAWYLRNRKNYRTLSGLIGPFLLTLLPMMLIILEPDLGTTMLFLPVLFIVLFVAGARVKHLLIIIALGLICSPVFYFAMEDYQKDRIRSLVKQNTDDPYWLRGTGYQLHQSKICIGSGGLTGHGWRRGIYVDYDKFLPERHNDFIFALIAHQWGLLGCLGVLGLYTLVILGGIEIASQHNDPFGRLLAVGISAQIAVQMLINIGMTIGLMPVTGLTLPFISYGGSSLLTSFMALGILCNVARHRRHQIARGAFEFDD